METILDDSTISADNKISFHARFKKKSFLIDKHRDVDVSWDV